MSNGNSIDGNLRAAIPLTSLAEPVQFRIVLVSFLAGAIGLIAGLVAFALYKLIGLFTNLFFLSPVVDHVCQRAVSHTRDLGHFGSGNWRADCRCDGEIRVIED